MWTPDALSSEIRPYAAEVWRVVEAQSRVSTMRLTDSLDEQRVLEDLVDEVKPPIPVDCRHLHWLLATPFRYAPYPYGSRFRRADQAEGAFYAGEAVGTVIAELAFYRLLFFAESPDTRLPERPTEHTAFSVPINTTCLIDLTTPPLDRDQATWTSPSEYAGCQALADAARAAKIEAIRYRSVRAPQGGSNIAVLSPRAFAACEPQQTQTWHLFIRPNGVQASREFPQKEMEFEETDFAGDVRLIAFWKKKEEGRGVTGQHKRVDSRPRRGP